MSDYEKAHKTYRDLVKKAANGDAQAFADKARAKNEIRSLEREAARAGTILSAEYRGDNVVVTKTETDSKRSLQEEYVRRFDNKNKVNVGGKEQTLQQFNRERLLGKK